MPHENQSVLSRVGKGLIAFGAGTTPSNIDTIRANRDIAEQNVELGQQEIEANQAAVLRQQRQRQLQQAAISGDPKQRDQAFAQLSVEFPEQFEQISESMGLRTQGQKAQAADFAIRLRNTRFEDRQALINQRVTTLAAEGRDPQHTASLTGLSEEDQDNALRATELLALTPEERADLAIARGGGTSKLGQSVVTTDPEGNLSFATPVLGPGGEVVTQTTPIGGTIVSRSAGETSAQRQLRDIETAGGQTTARAVSTRDQNFIDVGQRQADGTAIIRRGIQLLETIKTGTPESIALAATNLLGITGADETELNANLGKAVLSQLRSTFGAQFTESEGKRLANLEAGFGKSTAGNRRLLEQTLKSMERDARRGIDAATRNEDQFSIDEIEKALRFSIGPEATEEVDPALFEFMTPEQRALFEQ